MRPSVTSRPNRHASAASTSRAATEGSDNDTDHGRGAAVGGGVNRAQQDYWETEGPRQYQQFGDTNEALLAPAGQAMLDAALRPGERVLDVGCGFGTSTLEAAERVAPSGRIVGVDISAAMLQPARQRIAAAGVDNVELNFAPYAGQQRVVMDGTAWLVTARR